MRKKPSYMCLRSTPVLRSLVERLAKSTDGTISAVLEAGIILACRHYEKYGTLSLRYGAKNGDDVRHERGFL